MKKLLAVLMLMATLGAYGQSITRNVFTTNSNPVAPLPNGGLGISLGANMVPGGATYDDGSAIGIPAYAVTLTNGVNYILTIPSILNDLGLTDSSVSTTYGPTTSGSGPFTVPSTGTYYLYANNLITPVLSQINILSTNVIVIPGGAVSVQDLIASNAALAGSITLGTPLAWSQVASPQGQITAYTPNQSPLCSGVAAHYFGTSNGVDNCIVVQNLSGFNQPTGGHYSSIIGCDAHGNPTMAIGYGETNAASYAGYVIMELSAVPATAKHVPYFFGSGGFMYWGTDPGSYQYGGSGTIGRFVMMKANCTNFDATNIVSWLDQTGSAKFTGTVTAGTVTAATQSAGNETVTNALTTGSFATGVHYTTVNYIATNINDHTVIANSSLTTLILLPTNSPSLVGRTWTIKQMSAVGSVIVTNSNGSDHIDGSLNYTLGSQYKYVDIQSDGTNYWVIGNN